MPSPSFEFDPFPKGLYTAEALLDGFDPDRPETYATMRDTLIYQEFVVGGGAACGDYVTAMSRALHDNGINQALADAVSGEKIVAIMGGHAGSRKDSVYAETARLSAKLAAAGFTLASGGGPGIMEATHLGAAFGADPGLEVALKELAADSVPAAIPKNASKLVRTDGTIDSVIAEALGLYLAPAVRIMRTLGRTGGLGIPTWLYGHEPTTPFARPIAKYFQNSIREDGLLALATNGIVYMQGGAGTLQEVFQDAAQNYYKTFPNGPGKAGHFSPMVFYGDFWTKKIQVRPVLEALFGRPAKKPERNIGNEYADWVRYLADPDDVVAHLLRFDANPSPELSLLRKNVSIPSFDILDHILPDTVFVDHDVWHGAISSSLPTFGDNGTCYNSRAMQKINRDRLTWVEDIGEISACNNNGTMRAIRCAVR